MNIQKFLDSKHGKFIGRVYFLIALFVGNALIPIGAVNHFVKGGSSLIMYLGIAVTLIVIGILSTPYDLSQYHGEKDEALKK